ncbi:preprotein translocase SecG subunit [Streptomyces sp. AA4]|nr:preprotein translocase SecG subunit [Streptomyces sp. AA4]
MDESRGTVKIRTCAGPAVPLHAPTSTEDDMKLFLQILLIASSVLLVVAVLLHRGRGGGLSSLFGGGMQSSLAGSSVAEKNLDRITLLLGAIWLISIVGLGLLLKV